MAAKDSTPATNGTIEKRRAMSAVIFYRPFGNFGILEIWSFGGAVGVLPPESRKPNRCVLQAQLRIYLDRAYASKRGLPRAADP
jgi:hypothetical protein